MTEVDKYVEATKLKQLSKKHKLAKCKQKQQLFKLYEKRQEDISAMNTNPLLLKSASRDKQKRSTEGCSKFNGPDTRQVQERLALINATKTQKINLATRIIKKLTRLFKNTNLYAKKLKKTRWGFMVAKMTYVILETCYSSLITCMSF